MPTERVQPEGFAYSADLCFLLVCTVDGSYTNVRLNRYNPDTNSLVFLQQIPGGFVDSVVYDPIHKLFVAAYDGGFFTYDPVADLVDSTTDSVSRLIWEPFNSKIYCLTAGGVGYINVLSMASVTLGARTVTPYHITYSPLTNTLYGGWRTGLSGGLFKFDLNTNTSSNFVASPFLCIDMVWDTDRNLLVATGTDTGHFADFDVGSETVTADYAPPTDATVREFPIYVPTLKKVFAVGYLYPPTYPAMIPTGILSLNTTNGTVAVVRYDYDYRSILKLNQGSVFSAAFTADLANDYGIRRLCLT